MNNRYIIQFLIAFYKFTYFVEKVVDKLKKILEKEKEEYSKIITSFWLEHQIGDLLKISIFLFLILWVLFQSHYYGGGVFHISYDTYLQLKNLLFKLKQTNEQYLNAVQIQNEEIENISNLLKKCKRPGADPVTASMLLLIGTTLGLVVGSFLTLVSMSK